MHSFDAEPGDGEVLLLACSPGSGSSSTTLYSERIPAVVFRTFSPRFEREYQQPCEDKVVIKTPYTKDGIQHITMVLCGGTAPFKHGLRVRVIVQAALFFREWEMFVLEAYSLAWLRWWFIEQKNCPTDLLLAIVWQLTCETPDSPVREVLMGSLWRRIFFDRDPLPLDFWSQFSEMYSATTFREHVDSNPRTWFASFHSYCKPVIGGLLYERFAKYGARTLVSRTLGQTPNYFRSYVYDVQQLKIQGQLPENQRLDDDTNLSPKLDGLVLPENARVQYRYLKLLGDLELAKVTGDKYHEPLIVSGADHQRKAWPKALEAEEARLKERNEDNDDCSGEPDPSQQAKAPPTAAASVESRTAPEDKSTAKNKPATTTNLSSGADDSPSPSPTDTAATTTGAAASSPPTSEQSVTPVTPASDPIKPRRQPHKSGAGGRVVWANSSAAKIAAKKKEIANSQGTTVGQISDDHPQIRKLLATMKHAASPSLKRPLPTDFSSPTAPAPKATKTDARSEAPAEHLVISASLGQSVSKPSNATPGKLKSPEPPKIDTSKERHPLYAGDKKIAVSISGGVTVEFLFGSLKKHSALFNGFETAAEVRQPYRMVDQPLTKRAMETLESQMVVGMVFQSERTTAQEYVDHILATIVFRAARLEEKALHDFKKFVGDGVLHAEVAAPAIKSVMKLDDPERGRKLRDFIAEKLAGRSWESHLESTFKEIGERAGEEIEKVAREDVEKVKARMGVEEGGKAKGKEKEGVEE